MPAISFDVQPYSLDGLKQLFVQATKVPTLRVDGKSHVGYLHRYLEHIGAQTVVIESDYIDRDYFEDYAGYYVRCFNQKPDSPYGPRCHRLHFFKQQFTKDQLEQVLSKSTGALTNEQLQDGYLGFHVVKPLPVTFIGRTCLVPYEPDHDRRHYPIRRRYDVNLFGLKFHVDSLAFQEQDSVVAACATSALWSAFHGTGKLFQHAIPSPLEITKAATDKGPISNRVMPNRGLTIPMMTHAIRHIGLEPFAVDQDLADDADFAVLKSTLYAYLRAEVPVVLGIDLIDTKPMFKHPSIGFHAVTIAGYSLDTRKKTVPIGKSAFQLNASRIDKIYVHDDQVGPFARMEIRAHDLDTQWIYKGDEKRVVAIPSILLIPLYHKIRIPFSVVFKLVNTFDAVLKATFKIMPSGPKAEVEWDIYLTTVAKYKEEMLSNWSYTTTELRRVLLSPLPKYIWLATASIGGARQMDLLFDATNIEQGHLFVDAVQHTGFFEPMMEAVCQYNDVHNNMQTLLSGIQPILEHFMPETDQPPKGDEPTT